MRVLVVLLFLASALYACQICLPYPRESFLDRINVSESVVLARENPEKAYHLSAVEVLRGSAEGMDLYLPSATRRMLEVYPDRAIVCGRIDGEWQSLGPFLSSQRAMLDSLLSNSWGEDKGQRARYFSKYLNSADGALRKLSHLEVARAPYTQIRALEHPVSKREVLDFIADQRMAEWHALYILLFAQVADQSDAGMVRERFLLLAEHHLSLQLAAWTVAFLETGGSVEEVAQLYFDVSNRESKELNQVIGALGTYGSVEQGDVVAAVFRKLLGNRPELLPEVLPWLIEWKDYASAEQVASCLTAETDLALLTQARAFLKEAGQSKQRLKLDKPEKKGVIIWLAAGALLLCALALPFARVLSSPRES